MEQLFWLYMIGVCMISVSVGTSHGPAVAFIIAGIGIIVAALVGVIAHAFKHSS